MTKRVFLPSLSSIFEDVNLQYPFLSSDKYCSNEANKYIINEKEDEYVIEMNVAGVKKEDIEIGIKDEKLSVVALRKREIEENGELKESVVSKYEESFILNNKTLNLDNIEANLENGILTLKLSKKEECKYERQISIN